MLLVQTVIRLPAPFTLARTGRRFTFQRRRVLLLAWETLLPNCGPLPQRSHLAAMVLLQSSLIRGGISGRALRLRSTVHAAGRARANPGTHKSTHSSALSIIPRRSFAPKMRLNVGNGSF